MPCTLEYNRAFINIFEQHINTFINTQVLTKALMVDKELFRGSNKDFV